MQENCSLSFSTRKFYIYFHTIFANTNNNGLVNLYTCLVFVYAEYMRAKHIHIHNRALILKRRIATFNQSTDLETIFAKYFGAQLIQNCGVFANTAHFCIKTLGLYKVQTGQCTHTCGTRYHCILENLNTLHLKYIEFKLIYNQKEIPPNSISFNQKCTICSDIGAYVYASSSHCIIFIECFNYVNTYIPSWSRHVNIIKINIQGLSTRDLILDLGCFRFLVHKFLFV